MESPVVVLRPLNRQPLVLLVRERTEIGRECDGVIVPDPRMSRRHLALEPQSDGAVMVTDLGSSNGTTVDGEKLTRPRTVRTGSVVRAGDVEIVVGQSTSAGSLTTEVSRPPKDDSGPKSSIDAVADEVGSDLRPEVIGVRDEPGTLTLVFTDIEESTSMGTRLGDQAWFDLLSEHHKLVSAHAEANDGRVVSMLGDGYMLCFRSARQALFFSIGLQRDLDRQAAQTPETAIRVRIGLHTGEVLVDDAGDFIGQHVVVAARIANLAHGGESLASSVVKEIAEPRGDIAFVDPQEVGLKGIGGLHRVYRVDWQSSPF